LTLHAIAETKAGGIAALLMQNTFDRNYAEKM
jgi:hypothetical protein